MAGPSGGDGGRGGHIIYSRPQNLNTLLDLRYQREYKAQRASTAWAKMHGKNGEDRIIFVPVGTIIKDADTEEILADLDKEDAEVGIPKAGRGGLGNAHFATAVKKGAPECMHSRAKKAKKRILSLN